MYQPNGFNQQDQEEEQQLGQEQQPQLPQLSPMPPAMRPMSPGMTPVMRPLPSGLPPVMRPGMCSVMRHLPQGIPMPPVMSPVMRHLPHGMPMPPGMTPVMRHLPHGMPSAINPMPPGMTPVMRTMPAGMPSGMNSDDYLFDQIPPQPPTPIPTRSCWGWNSMPPAAPVANQDGYHENQWRGTPVRFNCGTSCSERGIIAFRLRKNVLVDMTVDRAIRICDYDIGIIIALSSCGTKAAMIHPGGCLYQYGGHNGRVEVSVQDHEGYSTCAKIWRRGISFTSEKCSLTYLVDDAGIRSTTDIFSDLWYGDFTVPTFLNDSTHNDISLSAINRRLSCINYRVEENDTEKWTFKGFRITQTKEGIVEVMREDQKFYFRINPNGDCAVVTPFVQCAVGFGRHITVRQRGKEVHYDGEKFIVKNGSHSGGFDQYSQVKVY